MNYRNGAALGVAGLIGLCASGCLTQIGDEDEGEVDVPLDVPVGEAASGLDTTNALSMNALSMNALSMNALSMNALSMNALSPTSLQAIQDPSTTGEMMRQLLRYTVGCALEPNQSFSFTWTDSVGNVHSETYSGSLGLAPSWTKKALNANAQEWVSACLAARTNWYGMSVTLSLRGDAKSIDKSGSPELTAYAMTEGAFWGNLFASTPHLYACHYGPNQTYSRSKLRDCAAGHLLSNGSTAECGMIEVVGACEDLCDPLTKKGKYYPKCTGPDGDESNTVITSFLM